MRNRAQGKNMEGRPLTPPHDSCTQRDSATRGHVKLHVDEHSHMWTHSDMCRQTWSHVYTVIHRQKSVSLDTLNHVRTNVVTHVNTQPYIGKISHIGQPDSAMCGQYQSHSAVCGHGHECSVAYGHAKLQTGK